MVLICSKTYPLDSDYEEYFAKYSFPLSDFQKHAIQGIVDGNHILITAHTGSGKTLPAEFAINYFQEKGKKIIYTSPIKALSNQKFYEFTQKYPHISFGLMTGDIKTNPTADVLIMTTEILMNYLFISASNRENVNKNEIEENPKKNLDFQIDIENELGCVVFDEVHYINDLHRGQTWEQTILMLPQHIQMIMLSATIDSPESFAKWCEKGSLNPTEKGSLNPTDKGSEEKGSTSRKQVCLCSTNHRVVPLTHYSFLTTNESIFKKIKDKVLEKQIRDSTNKLIMIQSDKGVFQDTGYTEVSKTLKLFDQKQIFLKRKMVLNNLALFLRDREMLPAIAFVFSRKNVELCAKEITVPLLEDDSKVPYIVRRECEQIIRKLPNFHEYMELPEYNDLVNLLEKGIGIHHSGMIPILREIVELMISKKYIKLLFATESFAIGLDCPIKTAVFTGITKFDGTSERFLHSHEYTQMAGRAGRRGIDTIGHVVHLNNLFTIPSMNEYKQLLSGRPQKLVSKFHVSYSTIFNLIKTKGNTDVNTFVDFVSKSMIFEELAESIRLKNQEIAEQEKRINQKEEFLKFVKTPKEICSKYIDLEEKRKFAVNKKRKEIEREITKLEEDFKYIKNDIISTKELLEMEKEFTQKNSQLEYLEKFIEKEIEGVCAILYKYGFITKMDSNTYSLTDMGTLAANIAEIHPLVLVKLANIKWANFEKFSAKQIVGLLSCFTDIKCPSDQKLSVPYTEDTFLKERIEEMRELYNDYECEETEKNVNTGIQYQDALIYDIIDETMEWCDCDTEEKCKLFIQLKLQEKSISIGDFTKALLKIVVITKELMNIYENNISLLHTLGKIESMILKYITTSQSLYV